MSTVYVACSSAEIERFRYARNVLVAAGHTVYDWSEFHRPTAELDADECRRAASADLAAIIDADAVLVLAPSVRSDALVEMGIALGITHGAGWCRYIVVAGSQVQRGIFASLADEEHEQDRDAIAAVLAWAGAR